MSRSIKTKEHARRAQGLSAVRGFRHGAGGDQARCGVDQLVAQHPRRIRHQGDERRRPCVHGKADRDQQSRTPKRSSLPRAKNNRKLVLGYILRVHPSWMKFIELGQTLGKPLVMRLNLNQQSNGPAWMWHKNLIDSLIPIVDCGVHYVDVMCQLTGAKPVRVHGIGATLWADAAKPNYGHLHVTFDDGSVGWYEAGWGPMMSEVAFFVKDVVGPKGAVSIVPGHSDRQGPARGRLGLGRYRPAHQDRPHPVPPRRSRPGQELHQEGRVHLDRGRAEPPGTLRSRAGLLPQGDQRGSRSHASRWTRR